MSKFTAFPQLVVDFTTTTASGKKETIAIREGDILKNVTFTQNGVTATKTGKVQAIMTTETKSTTNYGSCACNLRSTFAAHVHVDGLVLDCSDTYDADVVMIFVDELDSIGEIIAGKQEVELDELPEGGLAEVIANLEPGQELKLPAGEITEKLELPAGVVLRGANSGISAAKGYRAQGGTIEGETVIKAPIVVKGDVILDGITVEGGIVAAEDSNVVMSNTRVVELVAKAQSDAAIMVEGNDKNKPVKLVLMNCYFGNSVGKEGSGMKGIYNLINIHGNLQGGSVIKNCYFAADCCTNNPINIYRVEDGGVVDIVNNTFENSITAIRISGYEDMECTINCTNNTYMNTFTADSEHAEWAGLVLIQPTKLATSMGNVTVNIDGTVNKSEAPQIWYYYASANEPQFEEADLPKVFVNGVQEEVINVA